MKTKESLCLHAGQSHDHHMTITWLTHGHNHHKATPYYQERSNTTFHMEIRWLPCHNSLNWHSVRMTPLVLHIMYCTCIYTYKYVQYVCNHMTITWPKALTNTCSPPSCLVLAQQEVMNLLIAMALSVSAWRKHERRKGLAVQEAGRRSRLWLPWKPGRCWGRTQREQF